MLHLFSTNYLDILQFLDKSFNDSDNVEQFNHVSLR